MLQSVQSPPRAFVGISNATVTSSWIDEYEIRNIKQSSCSRKKFAKKMAYVFLMKKQEFSSMFQEEENQI